MFVENLIGVLTENSWMKMEKKNHTVYYNCDTLCNEY